MRGKAPMPLTWETDIFVAPASEYILLFSTLGAVFLSRETGISGNFVGRIKGAKCPFDLQFLTWDFS